jgi:V/A-type H+-transporting ATPase subunit B
VNIDTDKMLDTGWQLFASPFSKAEVGIKQSLTDQYWPEKH